MAGSTLFDSCSPTTLPTALLSAAVDVANAGDNTLVPGAGGSPLKIWKLFLTFDAPGADATLKAGTTVFGQYRGNRSEIDLAALPWWPLFVPDTADFVLTLSAAVRCTGTVWFTRGS